MLEKLMQHVEDGGLRSPRGSNKDIPDSLVIDVLTPTSSAPSSAYENAPVLSLFDNTVVSNCPSRIRLLSFDGFSLSKDQAIVHLIAIMFQIYKLVLLKRRPVNRVMAK